MKTQSIISNIAQAVAGPALSCRAPVKQDGLAMHRLAIEAGGLDVNSEYAYFLVGAHFGATSAIAESGDKPVGFVSAYLVPDMPYTLFIWQVAVSPNHRGRGVAQEMLKDILARSVCKNVRFVDTTVTPSNEASKNMFRKFAGAIGANIVTKPFLPREAFTRNHEEEVLLRIGPIEKKQDNKEKK